MTKSTRRPRGEGSVHPFRGRWRGTVAWTDATGKRHVRSVMGRTKEEAQDKLRDLITERKQGTLTSGRGTVGEHLTDWIERHRSEVRHSTWMTDRVYVNVWLIPAIGKRPLASLTTAEVDAMLTRFQQVGRPDGKPISAITARHIRGTLRSALNDAQRRGLVNRNVVIDTKPARLDPEPIVYLTKREVAKLLDASADMELGPLYALAVTTGLRRGELLALTWTDVEGGILRVRRSVGRSVNGWKIGSVKSKKSMRTLPLSARARQALETQRTRQMFARQGAGSAWQDRDGLVFTDATGRMFLPEYVSHRWSKDCVSTGVRCVRFHDLRHTAATMLLSAGTPMAVVSEWLGHSDIGITASAYAAVVPEMLADTADAMDRALG